ncbi:MAG: HlyC/CorC family transporter [Blastocatellia bacterium]|nr:HlyC/CorC family transporter [Blastocatellia bacterium]
MNSVAIDILFILLLLIANGLFAMSEIALVSSRKARLQRRAEKDAGARIALELAEAPVRFLSTVQIGITSIGILAGAFGGATISAHLARSLNRIPALAPYSEAISLVVVVMTITYLSLVVGELVPKRLALNYPERIASRIARPMLLLSRLTSPAVHTLSASSTFLLRLLRVRPTEEPPITEEEVKILIDAGAAAGVFEAAEHELVDNIFSLADQRIPQLMTPRLDVVWLDVGAPLEEIRRRIIGSPYSRMPVCQGTLDNILGVVKAKDLLARVLAGEPLDLRAATRPPLYVPETRTALQLLDLFKQSATHIAMVVDEHGALEGLVTMNDVLEAIVGEMPGPPGSGESLAVRREDGSWLLDGGMPISDFKELFSIERLPREEEGGYHTLAGFIMTQLGRLPSASDHFVWNNLRVEVVDMDRRRIDKVLVNYIEPDDAENQK